MKKGPSVEYETKDGVTYAKYRINSWSEFKEVLRKQDKIYQEKMKKIMEGNDGSS